MMDEKAKNVLGSVNKSQDLTRVQEVDRLKELDEKQRDLFVKKSNWQLSSDYPDDKASPDRWAWEFLKRNEKFVEETNVLFKDPHFSAGKRHDMDGQKHPSPVAVGHKEWVRYLDAWGIDVFYPASWLGEYDAPCRFKTSVADAIWYDSQFVEGGPYYAVVEERPDTCLIRFDLTKPIAPQVKAAANYLGANYRGDKSKLAHSAKKFRLYLRAYDGYSETKDYDKLADQFSNEAGPNDNSDYRQNVEGWVARAGDYIGREYLEIPMQFNPDYWENINKKQKKASKSK